jgi:uncharacterized protein (DUF433 family)
MSFRISCEDIAEALNSTTSVREKEINYPHLDATVQMDIIALILWYDLSIRK